jgi:ribulose-5-phosphate 4-epimerase/fuculose-1-phosphate aldolase
MPPPGRLGSVTGVTVTADPTTEPFPYSGCTSIEDERLHRKQRLAAAFRIFSQYGFDEGVAGHITARDPEHADRFWVNRLGQDFSTIKASDLLLVDHKGEIVEGQGPLNRAAFAIHSRVHAARPDVIAAAHSHSPYGKAWASLGRKLDPITQDACDFYEDHGLYEEFHGVVLDTDEGDRIGAAVGSTKGAILQNHGLLTVGRSVDEAAWWFIRMESCCQTQLLAEAAGTPKLISHEAALQVRGEQGGGIAGWFTFQPLYEQIVAAQPDLLD